MSNRFQNIVTNPGANDPVPPPPVVTTPQKAGTSSLTSVPGANATTTLLAANTARLGATVFNDSTANLFLALGAGATTAIFTVKMAPGSFFEVPFNYDGIITGFWDAVNGNARLTELSA